MNRFSATLFRYGMQSYRKRVLLSVALPMLLGTLMLSPPAALAESRFDVSGFASLRVGKVSNEDVDESLNWNFLPYDEKLSAQPESLIGLQTRYKLTPHAHLISQVNLSNNSESDAELDWAYLSYTGFGPLNIRIGKQRRPLFRFSDYASLGFSYSWVRPPLEVYGFSSTYDSINSIDFLHEFDYKGWQLTSEFYYGQQDGVIETAIGDFDFTTRNDTGIILSAEKFSTLFRFSIHHTDDMTVLPPMVEQAISEQVPVEALPLISEPLKYLSTDDMTARFMSFGLQYPVTPNLLLYGERIKFQARSIHVISAWYAGAEYSYGDNTFYYVHGDLQQGLSKRYLSTLNGLLSATGTTDPAVVGQIYDSFNLTNGGITSDTIGFRRVLRPNIAASIEWTRLNDSYNPDSANLWSGSIDFLFR